MKILKIEATVACVVLWCLSLMSLALGATWLYKNSYRVEGIHYFIVFIITFGLIIGGTINLLYVFYLIHEEKHGYYYQNSQS
ncbi:MAG: hypothetical protein K2P14_02410 [Anaeroplasmataceae bacterium]|jgi:hypothetical protein|nr:hypothetical protein [Anaeroplasmataceae bacterium]HRF71075.1 hypothetical protein [Candidatus Pelethenecus sp.]